ncbi:hypothetical protein CEXT_111291 [Caerostris extrusa]|uniref:Uncharacterized protein n=1 Tax=Caerostris extrusa TaxID=172846 RepID=A0AAV4RIG8_CAEEX|nr:hypothetical protein CEXT_111291 [Caerostris extrusa]
MPSTQQKKSILSIHYHIILSPIDNYGVVPLTTARQARQQKKSKGNKMKTLGFFLETKLEIKDFPRKKLNAFEYEEHPTYKNPKWRNQFLEFTKPHDTKSTRNKTGKKK